MELLWRQNKKSQMILSSYMRKIYLRIKKTKKYFLKNIYKFYFIQKYNKKEFYIISNNCWGGDLYQILNVKFNTPFIGLFINAPCYLKLLKNPEKYLLNTGIEFIRTSKYEISAVSYPIGKIDDIEIHFLHYKSEAEAKEKWNRRIQRMDWDKNKWFVKIDDRDHCSDDLIHEFHTLNYPNKISFTKRKFDFSENLQLNNPNDMILLHTTNNLFDFVQWLNTGNIGMTLMLKIVNSIFSFPSKF